MATAHIHGLRWEKDSEEPHLFKGIDFPTDAVTRQGFSDIGKRVLQDNDP